MGALSYENLAKLDLLKALISWDINIPSNLKKDTFYQQSIQGHMENGHGIFNGNSRKNTFIGDVVKLTGKDLTKAKKIRQNLIEDSMDLAERITSGKTNYFRKKDGSPILGFEDIIDYKITSHKQAAKGIAIMGCVDDAFWRADTIDKYKKTLDGNKLNIGYGKEYLVDLRVMKHNGLTLEDFTKKAHSKEEIKDMKRQSMIVKNHGKNIENLFIRRNEGLGCCDDLLLTSTGLIHGPDAMIAGWLGDGLDTYTKLVSIPIEGGYDQLMGELVQQQWREKYHEELITPEEIREIIYLGAKENTPRINLSSSHRRFMQKENGQSKSTILNHLHYTQTGKRPKNYKLGFTQIDSDKFYDTLEERFYFHQKEHLIPKYTSSKKNDKRKL